MAVKPSRKARPQEQVEDVRTGLGVEALKKAFRDNLFYVQGRHPRTATRNDLYMPERFLVCVLLEGVFPRLLPKENGAPVLSPALKVEG